MLIPLVTFMASAAVTLLLVFSATAHAHRSGDRDFSKPQKFHAVAVPRIGGVGIIVGMLAAAFLMAWQESTPDSRMPFALLACSAPAFLAGFIQDLSEAVTPRGRLLAASVSAVGAFWFLDIGIRQTDIPGLDWVASYSIGSLALTTFTVAGISNAFNIIDGFNGLASMCVLLALGALAHVSSQVGDSLVTQLALVGMGAVLGFFILNFPAGKIFLGDGGAYLLGFFVAELSILLLIRNPDVSPMFPLLVCIYPVFETLFSIYRRSVLRSSLPTMPDGIHLHSLVYRRILRWPSSDQIAKRDIVRRNSQTSPYLWALCGLAIVPAVLFWRSTPILLSFIGLFVLTYLQIYWRIVRFQVPRWLSSRR